jgi:hypothetical protein
MIAVSNRFQRFCRGFFGYPHPEEPPERERAAVNVLPPAEHLERTYARRGPFATVYLDATRATETGARELDVRWKDVRVDLAARGADDATLEAIEQAIGGDLGTPGRHGLVVVAADGELCFSAVLRDPPATTSASWSPLPHLMPYLAQRASEVPHIVVVADRTGADVYLVGADGGEQEQTVTGSATYPLHRTGADQWDERQFQHRVENNWETNAADVADAVRRLHASNPVPLIVVAGDVRARSMISDALGAIHGTSVRVVEHGGRAAGASADSLQHAVLDEVLRHVWRERRAVLEHLRDNLGRHEYAAAGVAAVVAALRMAQVDTLVISDEPSSTLRAWIGPGATDFGLDDAEAADLGVTSIEHERLDAALIRAVHGTGAQLVVTPGGHDYLPDGIGALLRYDTAS